MTAHSSRARVALLAAPWIAILLLIGAVQVLREQYLDAGVFTVVAALLALDAAGLALPERRLPRLSPVVLAAIAGATAIVLVLAPRHGVVAGSAMIAVGALILPVAWFGADLGPRPARSSPRALRRSAIAWAGLTVALCLLELVSFLLGRVDEPSKSAHPAVSDLLDPLLDAPAGKAVFVVAWLALGLLFATRRGRA